MNAAKLLATLASAVRPAARAAPVAKSAVRPAPSSTIPSTPSAPAHLRRGAAAEDAAIAHLQSRGLALIARNYRCPAGELDGVMLERGALVFVEVRYRNTDRFGGAARSVDALKQRKLQRAAESFLQSCAVEFTACRFDVVAVSGRGPAYQIEWLKDAF